MYTCMYVCMYMCVCALVNLSEMSYLAAKQDTPYYMCLDNAVKV